jgi:hypothetical protein
VGLGRVTRPLGWGRAALRHACLVWHTFCDAFQTLSTYMVLLNISVGPYVQQALGSNWVNERVSK